MGQFLFRILLVTAITCKIFSAYGQYTPASQANGFLPNVIPASPEASALGLYGNWPVSLYTGIPNISLPLYTVTIPGFELPISISYHAGGVKVDEVSSWTGTGFSLNAGGVISRTIVGRKDEDILQSGFLFRNMSGNYLENSYDLSNSDDYVNFREIAKNNIDTEPDVFFFNFAGFSGRFYFDKAGKFRSIPASSLKLLQSPVNNKSGSIMLNTPWKVQDDKGNTYIFSQSAEGDGTYPNGAESTRLYQTPGGSNFRINDLEPTAWYLTHIVPAHKADTLYFDYIRKDELYYLPQNQSYQFIANYNDISHIGFSGMHQVLLYNGHQIKGSVQQRLETYGRSQLSRIRWKNGEVRFTAGINRQDMTGKLLNEIGIYSSAGTKTQSFTLNYNYINKRYFLNTLVHQNSANSESFTHTFGYQNPGSLPERNTSNAEDHWGYYNGKSNRNLLPWHPAMAFDNMASLLSADREPESNMMQAGILNRVTYPTGGYTQFNYEANHYKATTPIGGGNPQGPIVDAYRNVTNNTTTPYQQSSVITLPLDQNITVKAEFLNYPNVISENMTWSPNIKIERISSSGSFQVYYQKAYNYIQNHGNFPVQPVGGVTMVSNEDGTYNLSKTETLNLVAGDYKITVDFVSCRFPSEVDGCGPLPGVSTFVYYKKYGETPAGTEDPIGGGLRVKQIIDYDHTGAVVGKKEYTYSPGHLLIYPKYLNQYQWDIYPYSLEAESDNATLCGTALAEVREITSSSQAILGFTQGSPVGYTEVKEFKGNGQQFNGYTSYRFSYSPDSLNEVQNALAWSGFYGSFDIMNSTFPATSFDYKRGNLLSKSAYKRAGSSYVLIDSVHTVYSYNDYNSTRNYNRLRGMRVKRMRIIDWPCGTAYAGYTIPTSGAHKDDLVYAFYDLVTGWVTQTSSTHLLYDSLGNNPVTMTNNYFYDNPDHLQPTRTELFASDGSKEISYTSYADDYTNTTGFIGEMKTNHQTGLPIEQVTYQQSGTTTTILSGTLTEYQTGGKGLVDEVQQLETTSPIALSAFKFSNRAVGLLPPAGIGTAFSPDSRYVPRLKYDNYDNKGNPLQVTSKASATINGPSTVYLWSYNKQYPIAEIKNADYATVASVLGGTTAVENFSNQLPDSAQVRVFLTPLRTNSLLKKAAITTYTYDPLVGMTSKTDEKGEKITYEYDTFQRLKASKDMQGKITQTYDYHYKQP